MKLEEFKQLKGKTVLSALIDDGCIIMVFSDGTVFIEEHDGNGGSYLKLVTATS